MKRRVALAALIFALWAFAVGPAFAHAELLEASPAAGSTARSAVRLLQLRFNEELLAPSHVDLYQGAFERALPVTCGVEKEQMDCVPDRPLGPGDYTLQWTALSADGHRTTGAYSFRVSPSSPLPLVIVIILIVGAASAIQILRRRSAGQGRSRLPER